MINKNIFLSNFLEKIKIYKRSIYLISNNIGNIYDISLRSLKVLNDVDIILTEDTRIVYRLLKHYSIDIKKRLFSFNNFNEKYKYNIILNKIINDNVNVALIPNKGTPLICDPGFLLISNAIKNNIDIISVPGPCSIISSLITSGLNISEGFIFKGFIPKKKNDRIKLFNNLKFVNEIIIFFETSIRLKSSLIDIKLIFNININIILVRELTKKYEEIIRTDLFSLLKYLENKIIKGEIILILYSNNINIGKKNVINDDIINIFNILNTKFNKNESIKLISNIYKIKRNKLYNFINNINNK